MISFIAIFLMISSGDVNNELAASVYDNPERIEELMRLKGYGVPIDIVMMVTSYGCKTDEEALNKPFIFPALEFMTMTEIVKEYVHRHNSEDDETDEGYHSDCGYETTEVNTYNYKDEIKEYLRVSDESAADINTSDFESKAQAAADARCSSNQIRIIQFNAIPEEYYLDAIKRCGVEKEEDIKGIFEIYKSGYFNAWLEEAATASGIEYGEYESAIVGYNSVHSAIRGMTAGSVSDFDGFFISPLDDELNWNSLVTCEFGTGYVGHTGMDIGIPTGTRIRASAAGKVILAQSNPTGYGLYVVIDHGNGYVTLYAHNSRLLASAGDRVEQGQLIALSGNTGNSTGPHLHIEFIVHGVPQNARDHLH